MITREDLIKIEQWLQHRTVRDTQLPIANELDGSEVLPIVQEDKNKVVRLHDIIKEAAYANIPDLFNVSHCFDRFHITLEEAVSLIPVKHRKLGLLITFFNENCNWVIYQFKGASLMQWQSESCWKSILEEALEELIYYPDEEDITGIRDYNRLFLKFKDKDYNPEDFSGLGRVYLRKSYEGISNCCADGEGYYSNVLTQDMIDKPNTIYIIQYDYTLEGNAIAIPENCILWFQGGSINNGSIYMNEAAVLGAFEFADMGDAQLFGKFNTGQIFTFTNDDYKAKEGSFFKASNKPSSSTVDKKNNKEVTYVLDDTAYTTETRQELRWWNGKEWVLLLDITDYNEIISIILDLVEKHNAEMSECYKYFKERCYAIEQRVDELENWREEEVDPTLEDHENRLTQAEEDINNLENTVSYHESRIETIENFVEEVKIFIENIDNTVLNIINNNINKIKGVAKSIEVDGETYTPDDKGKITLPNYPTSVENADRLTNKRVLWGQEFDGTKNVSGDMSEVGNILSNSYTANIGSNTDINNSFRNIFLNNSVQIFNKIIPASDNRRNYSSIRLIQNGDNASLDLRAKNAGLPYLDFTYNTSQDKDYSTRFIQVNDDVFQIASAEGNKIYIGGLIGWESNLPDFEEAKLYVEGNIKATGKFLGTALNADKVEHPIVFTGAVEKEYNGNETVTINIPTQVEVPQDLLSTIETLQNSNKNLLDRIIALENKVVQLQNVDIATINLEPGQSSFDITVKAVDINGREQNIDYDTAQSDGLTVG